MWRETEELALAVGEELWLHVGWDAVRMGGNIASQMLSSERVDWICASAELPRGVGVEADGAGGEVSPLGRTCRPALCH